MTYIDCNIANIFLVDSEITNKNAYVFQYNMEKFLFQSKKYMILDLSNVQYLNNSAIKIIVISAMNAKKVNKELVIAGNNPSVNEIFSSVKFKVYMKLFPSSVEALKYFQTLEYTN